MKRVVEFDSHNLKTLPTNANDSVILSNNGISHVVLHRPTNTIYKRSIPYLIENEIYWLNEMEKFGKDKENHPRSEHIYVPGNIQRFDKYTISMEYLGESQPVSDEKAFMEHVDSILFTFFHIRVRHGDLTSANVIVRDDIPHILDWAESRFMDDPRPDKRLYGDKNRLQQTLSELCK